uniref:RING-type domain-containing protein n=1 Tax=Kalanchoe fedtschenkoi TaxID=63787 RepID=A0A7N0RD15_KALFE
MDSPDPILLEDFGQKVDLTRRIREVLANYPEGTTVLKELIQNADDAGATKVSLCLDQRVHGTQSLLSKSLASWQGPALLAYNDAQFTEEDFVSISRIGGSSKQGHAWKTGRFGVGFNSVYHLTDLPSFVSGKYVVLFDPQGAYLPNISSANPGKRIDYVSSSALSYYGDQFFPYCCYGCDMQTSFSGTLFRFPLRTADHAASSMLSRQVYSEDDISSMLTQIYEEGVLSLLFLKSVLSIEICIWNAGEPCPTKLYSCSVDSENNDTTWHRQALLRISNRESPSKTEMDAFSMTFVTEAMSGSHMKKNICNYHIVQIMASSSSRIGSFARTALKEYDIHLLPWASVAACISNSTDDDITEVGRAFCFLPLPVRTGMPLHVNGFFEVSSNRRGIWYGEDMDRGGRMRSDWNVHLLEDVVAPSYAHLLLSLRELLGPTKLYYSMFPTGAFKEPWSILAENVYRNICDSPLLHSETDGGIWVSPREAYLHDKEFSKSEALGKGLAHLGMPIVHLSDPLASILVQHAHGFRQKVVTPDRVRDFIRSSKRLITLSWSYRLILLEYCLDDLIDEDVGAHLSDLPLLPLADGSFGSLSVASNGLSYFTCSELEYAMLQQISDRLIDRNIPPNILSRLTAIAELYKANVIPFSVNYFIKLLPRFLPANWKHKHKVAWDPVSDSSHPTVSWFSLFWQYLENCCDNLSLFSEWPIIPSSSGHLYRASVESKLINSEGLPEEIEKILSKVGCKILSRTSGVNHSDLRRYVSNADAAGILEAVFYSVSSNGGDVNALFQNVGVEERDEVRRFLLDLKWYIVNTVGDVTLWYCKRLPIYKVYDGQTFQFSDLLNPQKYLPPLGVPESLLGVDFVISLSKSEEEVLLRYFGVERLGKTYFYKKHVLTKVKEMETQVRDEIMLSILEELPQLCMEDASLKEFLRNLEFVPTHSGALRSPAMLYDPRNEDLYALLEDANCFPSGMFEQPDILDILQGLGLRTSISPESIIQSARQIELLMHGDQQKAYLKGMVLLSYLEVNAVKWLPGQFDDKQGVVNKMLSRASTAVRPRTMRSDLEKFWNDLRMICWCPVLVSPPFQSLPWPVVTCLVAPPKLVRLKSDMWLVSASMRILDGECSSTALSHHLGWSSTPAGTVIAAQLLELGKNNEIVTDQELRRELALIMPRIYSILTSLMKSDEMEIVKAVLEGCRWIWVGDGFATSDEVVLEGPLHLTSYVRVIPIDLAVFRELFMELGIRESLKSPDFANILVKMASKKGSSILDAQEIRTAVFIAQQLAEAQCYEQKVEIFLPDMSGRLVVASELVYNDAPWFDGSKDPAHPFSAASSLPINVKKSVQKFVHGNISNDVAERLGVCSLRRTLLAESADSMNLSLSGSAEAFGQHEALTTRLRHILEMYADGPGIFFELVQNAEDAGASEVSFLLDKTRYGTSSLLSPEMADWQGPALYCYNNSVFSPQDLYAITRIGQESKLEKPFAIGRFGLGFNCVYHFTDIPCFVSGDSIVIFDPHACHLPGISPSHPGLRIKFAGRNILGQFPDQFSPFLHFGCDMLQPFPATLFRFPLRNGTAATRSQIKKEGYTPTDVMSLFTSFSQAVSETVLFLRNVKTISVFVKEGADSEMKLLHRVRKNHVSDPETESSGLLQIYDLMNEKQHNDKDKGLLANTFNKSVHGDLPWKCEKIAVIEESLSKTLSHCWITSNCLHIGRVRDHAKATNKSHTYVPWACVAAYLQSVEINCNLDDISNVEETFAFNLDAFHSSSGLTEKKFEGRAFCFLPLPICTGLPAHVNAYFELSSNRRDIWFGNDMTGGGKKRSDWNLFILENVAAPAYGHLLEKLSVVIGPCDLFFSYWPVMSAQQPWASMVRTIYTFVADHGLRVLYTKANGGLWISPKQSIFPDFSYSKVLELVEGLADTGLPLVSVPEAIVNNFLEYNPSLHYLSSRLLRNLLIRRKRVFKHKNAMILALEYCLYDLDLPNQSKQLYGLPLLPLCSGSFTTFDQKGAAESVYIARGDEFGLLKDYIPHQLVDCGIPPVIYKSLCDIAQSEESNITYLSCSTLEKLFIRLLPAEWHNSKRIFWTPGHQGHPSSEWLRLLWSYLKSYCDDLSMFKRWPVLPVHNRYLVQLTDNSNVIQDEGWSENMHSLLMKVGFIFLDSELEIEHPLLENYVQSPTARGILNGLLAIAGEVDKVEGLFIDASEAEMHELLSFILQSRWFHEDQMQDIHINIIKRIPMFVLFESRKLASLCKSEKWVKPKGVRDDLLDDSFVRAESEKERIILMTYLGIEEPSRVAFYKERVLNRMEEFVSREGAVAAILNDVKLMVQDDSSTKGALSTAPFVLAADGSWKQPSRLYDPRVPELQKILDKKRFFPSESFLCSEILDTLASLGLRTFLGYSELIDCARSVSMMHGSGDSDAFDYGKRILVLLDAVAATLAAETKEANECGLNFIVNQESLADFSAERDMKDLKHSLDNLDIGFLTNNLHDDDKMVEEFWSEIKVIPWCPVYAKPPLGGLPGMEGSCRVASPDVVRPMSHMIMVSSQMHILDGDCSETLQRNLGWLDPPKLDILTAQLIELSKSYCHLKLYSQVELALDAALQEGMPLLYSKLQNYVGTDDFTSLRTALAGLPWVWIGDDFVLPNVLAFDSPVKFCPYMYVVPSELSSFRDLLVELGVRQTFGVDDYCQALQHLQKETKGMPLGVDHLSFVFRVLEAVADCFAESPLTEMSNSQLLAPDSYGVLRPASDLVYNDAPWMDNDNIVLKHFIHPDISHDLASRLGLQSLRYLSLVEGEMTNDLPCMDYLKIKELLGSYGNNDFLLYDLLELADCCKADKLHLIFDKREHPRQSLLQHNLGEFQGPAVVAVLEGVSLSRDEITSLQLLPPWRLRGQTINYGLGLFSCFFLCDLLSIVSGDNFYIFDPLGLVFSVSSGQAPAARVFSLSGTNLVDRFRDQFSPMMIAQDVPWYSRNSTFIRMPLSSECMESNCEVGLKRIRMINETFMEHASRMLLFLKSVVQVSISRWDETTDLPCQDYMVSIDPSFSIMRNPFSEKKWRKFQLSRFFSSSNAAVKYQVIDVNTCEKGTQVSDQWLVVLTLGSGQTRNMALDRKYLAYNLTPVAGVAVHISRDGLPLKTFSSSAIMSPLPLSGSINIPVTVIGCFLVCHNNGRYLFKYQDQKPLTDICQDAGNLLVERWNTELMSCVRDSYIEVILQFQKLRKEPSLSSADSALSHANLALKSHGDHFYSYWPRASGDSAIKNPDNESQFNSSKISKADWECIVEQVIRPFYARVVDLPVWKLYSGSFVKADEGMFLSQPGKGVVDNVLPATLCSFVKERYPVFSVPWELVTEIQEIGVIVREIRPKMVRELLKASFQSVVIGTVDTYVDILDYCMSDIRILRPSSVDGAGTSLSTSNNELTNGDRQGEGSELTTSNERTHHGMPIRISTSTSSPGGDALEMVSTLGKALFDFGRGVVEDIGRAGVPLGERSSIASSSNSVDQKYLSITAEIKGLPCPTAANRLVKLGIVELWLGNRDQQKLMSKLESKFIHPNILERSILADTLSNPIIQKLMKLNNFSLQLLAGHMKYLFHDNWVDHVMCSNSVPWFSWKNVMSSGGEGGPSPEWLRLFWRNFNGSLEDLSLFSDWPLIPAFLGRPVLCRVREHHLVFIPPFIEGSTSSPDTLQSDYSSNGSKYGSDELDVLRSLPIFKTVLGSYTQLHNQDLCMVSSSSFLKPRDEHCLSCPMDSIGGGLLRVLGVSELHDQQILVKFGLLGFETKLQSEQEDILIYVYMNWPNLQSDVSVVQALKDATFVRNSDELCTDLFKPCQLFDPGDALLASVFFGERSKFPGERFVTGSWLPILRKAGLRTAVEPDVIIECAKRVEILGTECKKLLVDYGHIEADKMNSMNEVSSEIWSLAISVLEHVFANFAVLYSNSFCGLLGEIKCVPAEKGFPSLGGKKGGQRVLTSYSEAVLLKDWPLAWSCNPILIRQCVPPEYSWGAFHLRSPPAFSTVLKHLQVIGNNSGEDTLVHWPIASGTLTVDQAACEILKYLDKIWGTLSAADNSDLRKVAFIPTANGSRLVTANALFARLSINLSPFAFELPSLYLPFVRILKELGLQEYLTTRCAKDLLLDLQKACGYQRLNPNELRAVLELLIFACEAERSASDIILRGSEAVVPDDGSRLIHADACVFIDTYGSHYIKHIDSSRIRFVHPNVPVTVCAALGIKKLSDVVIEEVDDLEILRALDVIQSVPLAAIKARLLSTSFKSALWNLIHGNAMFMATFKNLAPEKMHDSLTLIAEELQFVDHLHTRFLLLPKSVDITSVTDEYNIPEWRDGNRHRTLYFVSRSNNRVLVAEPPTYISVLDVLARVVSHILGSPTLLPIGPLFICPEESENAIIDILKLCSERRYSNPMGGDGCLVGKELLPQDIAQVQLHPLRPFYSGEIIAWRSQNGKKLKYGRIPEDVRPSAGQALYKFKVETAPGTSELLLSSQVLSFRSIAVSNDPSSSMPEGNSAASPDRLVLDMAESSSAQEATSQNEAGIYPHFGRVSATELVQAVQEMLSAAGVDMDSEKQSLLKTTLTLEEQLVESRTALLLEQERADTALKEADIAKAAWTCRICLNAEVDHTIVPCGHVLCRRCSSAVTKCPFCRIQVSRMHRIYRP